MHSVQRISYNVLCTQYREHRVNVLCTLYRNIGYDVLCTPYREDRVYKTSYDIHYTDYSVTKAICGLSK